MSSVSNSLTGSPVRDSHLCISQTKNARITALALVCISLVFFSLACALLAMGNLPAPSLMGLGFMFHMGGVFVHYIGMSVLLGAVVIAIASLRSSQPEALSQ